MITLTSTSEKDVTVVESTGRLTMATASDLTAVIDKAITDGAPKVIIDLAQTVFVDSTGLGALVSGLRRAREAGGDLRIVAPSEQVSTVLSLTNLDRVLFPFPDVEAARREW